MGIQVGDDKIYNRIYMCSVINKYGIDFWSVKIMWDYFQFVWFMFLSQKKYQNFDLMGIKDKYIDI